MILRTRGIPGLGDASDSGVGWIPATIKIYIQPGRHLKVIPIYMKKIHGVLYNSHCKLLIQRITHSKNKDSFMATVEFTDELLTRLNLEEEEFKKSVKESTAILFHSRGKLTTGQAAVMAGMSQYELMKLLNDYDLSSIKYSAEELERELAQ